MTRFLIRRISVLIPMMFLMSLVAYAIILAPPGDYLDTYIESLSSSGVFVDTAEIEDLKRQYGLDKPAHIQYLKWVGNVMRGNLGRSLEFQRPITELIGERLALTVLLGLFTVMFTWTLAIPIGIISAVKQYSFIDYFFTFLSYFGVGTPNFLLALVVMWFIFAWLG